jgi:hypothetical protein
MHLLSMAPIECRAAVDQEAQVDELLLDSVVALS